MLAVTLTMHLQPPLLELDIGKSMELLEYVKLLFTTRPILHKTISLPTLNRRLLAGTIMKLEKLVESHALLSATDSSMLITTFSLS